MCGVWMYTFVSGVSAWLSVCLSACNECACICLCICSCSCLGIDVGLPLECGCVCVHAHAYTCMYVYIYIYYTDMLLGSCVFVSVNKIKNVLEVAGR